MEIEQPVDHALCRFVGTTMNIRYKLRTSNTAASAMSEYAILSRIPGVPTPSRLRRHSTANSSVGFPTHV
jgi:hypothetical protein